MCGRRKQSGRRSDVRPDDVRRPQVGFGDQPGQELTHRSRREEVISALGRAEPRQVDREQAGVLGERGPDRRERIHALGPGTGEQHRPLMRAAAVGIPDPDAVNGSEFGLDRC
jgi:hypothetical protein